MNANAKRVKKEGSGYAVCERERCVHVGKVRERDQLIENYKYPQLDLSKKANTI